MEQPNQREYRLGWITATSSGITSFGLLTLEDAIKKKALFPSLNLIILKDDETTRFIRTKHSDTYTRQHI